VPILPFVILFTTGDGVAVRVVSGYGGLAWWFGFGLVVRAVRCLG